MSPCLFTIPIVGLNENRDLAILGLGSGCLVVSAGKKIVLGVSHVLEKPEATYAMHVRNDINDGAQFFSLNPTRTAWGADSSERAEPLDFFLQVIPEDIYPKEQPATPAGVLLDEQDKRVFAFKDILVPEPKDEFGFCGLTKPVRAPDYTDTTRVVELGLKFDRKEETHLVFKLAHPHPGEGHYEGCSGAPILNQDEKLASLVIGGCIARGEIHGLDLARFKSAIPAEALSAD
jgi:hypothetical protein